MFPWFYTFYSLFPIQRVFVIIMFLKKKLYIFSRINGFIVYPDSDSNYMAFIRLLKNFSYFGKPRTDYSLSLREHNWCSSGIQYLDWQNLSKKLYFIFISTGIESQESGFTEEDYSYFWQKMVIQNSFTKLLVYWGSSSQDASYSHGYTPTAWAEPKKWSP